MHFYVILTEQFCNENNGYTRDNLTFGFSTTIAGQYVASVNSLNEFPELFTGISFSIVPLGKLDFPSPPEKTTSVEVPIEEPIV